MFLLASNCYFKLRPNFGSHCFNSPESKAQVRYVNEYIDGLLSLSVHFFKEAYEGCPSKSWTFVITRNCVPVILLYFHDVFIYLWKSFYINMGGIAV